MLTGHTHHQTGIHDVISQNFPDNIQPIILVFCELKNKKANEKIKTII